MRLWQSSFISIVISLQLVTGSPADSPKPVKVFILAGQSNMEGQGFIESDP